MHKYTGISCVYLCAILAAATCILGQQHRKPWPTYSLQNMPQTRFTCHDKILGGYYADAETQCQMFHVCVKVSGVGVQDFRFLCPNGTAFDQEAQICADWGDVDCEQSVLYYGSDNFDLYRLGSGFESKRAPAAEEEEATFHLQRAESADIRRSKETRVDQKSRPDQPPNYTKRFEATPRSNSFNNYANTNANNYNNNNNNNHNSQQQLTKQSDAVKRPIVNYYTPTTSTTTTTTTERYSNDESKQEFDDIFKGSHSSHFFSNRNGGREDDFVDHPAKSKFNDFNDYNKKSETTTSGKTRAQPTRSRRIQTPAPTTTTTSSTTLAPKITKKVTLQTSYNASYYDFNIQKSTTPTAITLSPSTTTTRPAYSNANRFSFNANDYYTQEKIVPTTYNPGNSIYRVKTTTPKYNELQRDHSAKSKSTTLTLQNETTKSHNKPTSSSRKAQKLERTQQKLGPRNSTFVNHNEFAEFTKLKPQQPQPFQPAQVFRAPAQSEPQYQRTRAPATEQTTRASIADSTQRQRGRGNSEKAPKTTVNPELRPRGFTSRGSINYKATTQSNGEFYAPTSTTANGAKKFSTLVPKDQYSPTTFKPTTYQKSYDNFYYQTQQTVRPTNKPQKPFTTTTTTTTAAHTPQPTTANPYYNVDEDDGQYHPELYEIDVPRNRLNLQRSSTSKTTTTTTTTTTKPHKHRDDFQNPQIHLKSQQQSAFRKQQEQATPVDLSDEEELFKTAHSLNFGAASINKLRADIYKAEKTSQQYNSQYSPNVPASSPRTVATTIYQTTSSPSPSTSSPSTYNYYAYTTHSTTVPTPTSKFYTTTTTTTPTTPAPFSTTLYTTKRPLIYGTTTAPSTNAPTVKSSKSPKSGKSSKSKAKKAGKSASKRPPHADEDTSYDYAYYDSDTLSESPQEYPEYEIAEFTKTRKN